MTIALINVGSAPNDGTGDVWRNAWIKTNNIISALNNGPLVMGPPSSSLINLTIDQGTFQQNSVPGLWIKSTIGFGAGISIGGNGGVPGAGANFDFQQAVNGNGFIIVRANATMNFWTNNVPRMNINATGGLVIQPPTANNYGLFVDDNNIGGGNGAIKARSTSSPRISTFDTTQANGGYIAVERNGADGGFFGNSAALAVSGFLDAYCLRSNAGLDLASGGANIRVHINSAGNVTLPIPDSGVNFAIDQGTLDSGTNPGIQTKGNAGFGSRISICGNGSSPSINSFDLVQVSTGDVYIVQRSNNNMAIWTNNTPALLLSNFQQAFFYGNVGVNGNTPPVQVVGFGTPTGTGVINNFNGAGATLPQCSQAIAQIIKDLKAFGLYGV
jgi:hypothetical protein